MSEDFAPPNQNIASDADTRTEAQKSEDIADELFGDTLFYKESDSDAQSATRSQHSQNLTNSTSGSTLLSGNPASFSGQETEYAEFDLPPNFNANEGLMQEFKGLAAQYGLSQDAAQSLLNLQVKSNEYLLEQMQAQRQAWVKELNNDRSYGGRNFHETVQDALKTLHTFDPEARLSTMLEQTGFGDNPDVIRFLANIARAHLKEDKLLTGRGRRPQTLSLADELWPD